MKAVPHPLLASLARKGLLGLGIPAARGGTGGSQADLFEAVSETARQSVAAARMFAVQRHFAEVLLACENIGLAEYRLGDILDGSISGACTATWPQAPLAPLTGRAAGAAWRVSGALPPVPNIGAAWFLVTAMLQTDPARSPFLVLLSSEQDGLRREGCSGPGRSEEDDAARLTAANVFFRADEILQEDATRVSGQLSHFAALLRKAIAAGVARGDPASTQDRCLTVSCTSSAR